MRIVMTAEKPSVARAYADALDLENKKSGDGKITGHSNWDGNDYTITWSIGHLVTLSYPEKYDAKYKKWDFNDLPFLPDQYKYELIPDGKKQFQVIKSLYNDPATDRIILAGDSGREGLYIQALILMMSGDNKRADKIVLWIDSQTKEEIRRGLKEAKPLSAYENLRNAGYMRAIEDYSFGLNYSRMLTCKFGREFNNMVHGDKWKAIAVGRVMTCVLGMTVDREREIKNFVPMSFYKILGSNDDIRSAWLIDKDSAYAESADIYDNKGFKNRAKAEDFLLQLNKNKTLKVSDISEKTEKKKAPLLYNLAELQAECSKRFKISPDQTLSVAQKLYESQLITYPRTDARVLSTAVCKEIKGNLNGLMRVTKHNAGYVNRILTMDLHTGLEKTVYCDDTKITDHYAMIPTGKGNPSGLSEIEEAIYFMIVDRFLCIFFPQAEYSISTITLVHPCGERFRASEKNLVKAGFLEILGTETVDTAKGKFSSRFKKGDVLSVNFTIEDGKTTPPPRYTSGSMILAMENAGKLIENEELRAQIKTCGIGTSATRAGILKKLVANGYLNLNKKTQVLTPHADGEAVYDIVKKTVAGFLSPETTASWEKGLSMIENGDISSDMFRKKMETEIVKTYKRISAMN